MFGSDAGTSISQVLSTCYLACLFVQIQHLQKVLVKKRDPVTHVCFIEELAKVGMQGAVSWGWGSDHQEAVSWGWGSSDHQGAVSWGWGSSDH